MNDPVHKVGDVLLKTVQLSAVKELAFILKRKLPGQVRTLTDAECLKKAISVWESPDREVAIHNLIKELSA